ncbi:hypothetical protein [Clostridium sp.]|uniref:hypothetical protein n=1 Tax=Clostridium sp. TaxID=1506 RepID=UPI002FC62F9E
MIKILGDFAINLFVVTMLYIFMYSISKEFLKESKNNKLTKNIRLNQKQKKF